MEFLLDNAGCIENWNNSSFCWPIEGHF